MLSCAGTCSAHVHVLYTKLQVTLSDVRQKERKVPLTADSSIEEKKVQEREWRLAKDVVQQKTLAIWAVFNPCLIEIKVARASIT